MFLCILRESFDDAKIADELQERDNEANEPKKTEVVEITVGTNTSLSVLIIIGAIVVASIILCGIYAYKNGKKQEIYFSNEEPSSTQI